MIRELPAVIERAGRYWKYRLPIFFFIFKPILIFILIFIVIQTAATAALSPKVKLLAVMRFRAEYQVYEMTIWEIDGSAMWSTKI